LCYSLGASRNASSLMRNRNYQKQQSKRYDPLEARLDHIDETHLFDGRIYKPKGEDSPKANTDKRGTSSDEALFVRSDGLVLAISFFSALISFATLVAVGMYTDYARRQWEEMRTAAISAKGANELAKRSFEQDQRAWVGAVAYPRPDPPFEKGKFAQFKVLITNSGKTPALRVRSNLEVWMHPAGEHFVAKYNEAAGLPSVSVIQPGMQPYLGSSPWPNAAQLPGGIPDDAITALKSKTHLLYVYGRIWYDDTSGHTHHTIFCATLNPDLVTLDSCPTYNDAD
jgi:hypothetical protein